MHVSDGSFKAGAPSAAVETIETMNFMMRDLLLYLIDYSFHRR